MTKQELKIEMTSKGYETFCWDVLGETIMFNCCKGNKCYYAFYDNEEAKINKKYKVELEYAGKRSDLE